MGFYFIFILYGTCLVFPQQVTHIIYIIYRILEVFEIQIQILPYLESKNTYKYSRKVFQYTINTNTCVCEPNPDIYIYGHTLGIIVARAHIKNFDDLLTGLSW